MWATEFFSAGIEQAFFQKIENVNASKACLPYLVLCNSTGTGKTRLLLETLYAGQTPSTIFEQCSKVFLFRRYVSFKNNGAITSLCVLPAKLAITSSTSDNQDLLTIGLRFVIFLLRKESKFHNNNGYFKYNGDQKENTELFNNFPYYPNVNLKIDTLIQKIKEQTKNKSILLAVDEASQLLDCQVILTTIDKTESRVEKSHLLELLRIAVSYLKYSQVSILLIVASTQSSISTFLPSLNSSSFRMNAYADFFGTYDLQKRNPQVFTRFPSGYLMEPISVDIHHLLDNNDLTYFATNEQHLYQLYRQGRYLWRNEFDYRKDETDKILAFYTFVLDKLFGKKSGFSEVNLQNFKSLPDSFYFSLVFHRVSMLGSHVDTFTPEMVGQYCVPAHDYDVELKCFSLACPYEPCLAAGSAYLMWKYPEIRKEVWRRLMKKFAPLPAEKGNHGELFATLALLLKLDDYKMLEHRSFTQTYMQNVRDRNDIRVFFSMFPLPVTFKKFLCYLDSTLKVEKEFPDIQISAIHCIRFQYIPPLHTRMNLFLGGTMFLSPPCFWKQDGGIIYSYPPLIIHHNHILHRYIMQGFSQSCFLSFPGI